MGSPIPALDLIPAPEDVITSQRCHTNETATTKEVLNDDSASGYIDVHGEISEVLLLR